MALEWIAIVIIVLYFLIFFAIGTLLKNNSIVDMGWGFGFVLPATVLFFLGAQNDARFIALFMVAFWGLRLTYYLVKRNLGQGEDFRYKLMRRQWGQHAVRQAFVKVYGVQAFFMIAVGFSLFRFLSVSDAAVLTLWAVPGLALFFTGLYFEAVGDSELRLHLKAHPKTLCTTGVWRFTRHPNYFGDAAMWMGMYVYSVALVPSVWWTVFSPLVMFYLLRYVSGVPLMERRLSKKPGWEEYQQKTNLFFPWFPKEG